MAFKQGGTNLSEMVYGLGTATTYDGFSADGVVSHFKVNGSSLRYVKKNDAFMPFSQAPAIDGYTVGGVRVFDGNYAEVNRFLTGNTVHCTFSEDTNGQVIVYYKGGGSRNSKGILRINDVEYPNCPPVIFVFGQGGGGNGGDGEHKNDVFSKSSIGGGGGGSGAFCAFFLELPYDTKGEFVHFGFSYSISSGAVYFAHYGVNFMSIGRGGNGGRTAGGAGGKVSVYPSPSYVRYGCLKSDGSVIDINFLSGANGGAGSEGSSYNSYPSNGGAVSQDYFSMVINSIGLKFPIGSNGVGGTIKKANGFGGGGAGSRFGNGGTGGTGSLDGPANGGDASGFGAGGGGGTGTQGDGLGTHYNSGGKGGKPYMGFVW